MPVIDLAFHVLGSAIPADHGFLLFSAVSEAIPSLHASEGVGIHSIAGRLSGDRRLSLTDHSRLTLRLPAERITEVLPLAGHALQIGEHTVRVGVPTPMALVPAPHLYCRVVTIKGFLEPEGFLGAVQRQLCALEIAATPSLVAQPHIAERNAERAGGTRSPFLRRTLRIHDKEVVGFAVRVEELTAEESVRLQETGLGGRRRFGCGLFIPDRS